MNIALFTPSQNPYSETFVQAHKNLLTGNVFYYYGAGSYTKIEGADPIFTKSSMRYQMVRAKFFSSNLSYKEAIIARSLKRNKIDVILAEFGTHAHKILNTAAQARIPMVVHFHGYDASADKAYEQTDNYKLVFEYASKVIAVSNTMAEMLVKHGCPENKIVINPCAPADEFYRINPLFSKKQILAMGRFVDKKAPYYNLLTFAEILKYHPDSNLVFAGDGPLLETCINLAHQLGIKDHVHFTGVIDRSRFVQYIQESMLFVQHSIKALNGDMEGTPVTIQEASLAGLPVVSTNHGGIKDVVVHGKTGLLCNEHDLETMTVHIRKLLDSPKLAQEMGSVGKDHIKRNFNMKTHINVLQKTLEAAV